MPEQQAEPAPDPLAVDFVARLGGAMVAGSYPIATVRRTLERVSARYGLTNQMLLLPNFIQFGGSDHIAGTRMRVVRADNDLRYDQAFPLAMLVKEAENGRIGAVGGLAELDRIHALQPRFPAWVSVIGYAVQSTAFALMLQPTPVAMLAAAGFGVLVGMLNLLGRISNAAAQMLPVVGAFLVAFTAFSLKRAWHIGDDSLRDLTAPLALFLPGTAITLAVIDLTTREVVSGTARLVAGFMRLAQLTFGILIAAQILHISADDLNALQRNQFGAWAPWAGVALYAVGILLYLGPPNRFLPWLLVTLLVTYAGQVGANAVFGTYASGFGGGLVLMLFAVAVAQRPNSPPSVAMLLPGFWLLVPGSLGLIGVTQLVSANASAAIAVTVVSMISIALGMQAGLLMWRGGRQLAGDPRTD